MVASDRNVNGMQMGAISFAKKEQYYRQVIILFMNISCMNILENLILIPTIFEKGLFDTRGAIRVSPFHVPPSPGKDTKS